MADALVPDYTGLVSRAMVHGALRDQAGLVVWACTHPHISRETALACAEEELNRRERDG